MRDAKIRARWTGRLTPKRVYVGLRRVMLIMNQLQRMAVIDSWGLRPDRSGNPLTARPRCYWSQADEDGILENVLLRTGPSSEGVFIEYGVSDGAQCNTLVLLAKGWRGVWIGGEELAFQPKPDGRLVYERAWITLDNVVQLTQAAQTRLNRREAVSEAAGEVHVVSLDLDGNDIHLAEALLAAGIRPRVWIAEYNARFPVGSHWIMKYDESHTWNEDDYYGASLSSFAALFDSHGYFPVACSISGANVFFVRNDFRELFQDVPRDLESLYQPLLFPAGQQWGHRVSAKTLESLT